jgi:hypothetical protein
MTARGRVMRSIFYRRFWRERWRFEPDAPVAGGQRCDEFLDRSDQILKLGIVSVESCFEFGELRHDVLIDSHVLAHLHEGANYEDAHFDGSLRVQHTRSHDRAVLGEGVRQIAASAML